MKWIFVSFPRLPVEDIQQWCLDLLPEDINSPKFCGPIDTLTNYANDIYFSGNGEKFQISYYIKWDKCISCGLTPEVHHPFIDGIKSKEFSFCDSCLNKLYGKKLEEKIKHNNTQNKNFTKKIDNKIKANNNYNSYIENYGKYSTNSVDLAKRRNIDEKENMANDLINQLSCVFNDKSI